MNAEFEQLKREIDQDLVDLSARLEVEPPVNFEQRLRHRIRLELAQPTVVTSRGPGWVLWAATAAAAVLIATVTSIPLAESWSDQLELNDEWQVWTQALQDSQGTIASALDETRASDIWSSPENDIEIDAYLESYDLWLGSGI